MIMLRAKVELQDSTVSMVEALVLVIVWLAIHGVSLLPMRLEEHGARSRRGRLKLREVDDMRADILLTNVLRIVY